MPRLRLVTFNIAHGRGLTPIQGLTSPRKIRVNLRKIAALLARLKPDVVAMQEIDENSRWAGSFDHLDYLRVHARFEHGVFGINNRRAGFMNLCYGNALLSQHQIGETETVVFGRRTLGEKGFLFAEIPVGGKKLAFVNLHLHAASRRQRLTQLDLLIGWLRQKQRSEFHRWAMPPIICGDFNNPHTRDDATVALQSHLHDYGDYTMYPQIGGTFPSPMPRRRLDFIFLPSHCHSVQCSVLKTLLSDHCPVMVEFDV
ncbi:MAG TPA: endonuclease/exonuclease/phosphatase family protein [Opitutaceae bacterium]|jgi:endonuclease/exonuclease/phosphatase family metal-dependent hydrolase